MSRSTALVTIAAGERYAQRWRQVCRDNWYAYAERHGYDVICLESMLDDSPRARARSVSWQRCLILSREFSERYERLVWLDSDILLNPHAPGIVDGVPMEKIGAVDQWAAPTPELFQTALAKMYAYWEEAGIDFVHNTRAEEFYTNYGFPDGFKQVVQAAVMVLSPQHHRALLETVYADYEERPGNWNFEMRPLSYELVKSGRMHWLDPRFNVTWPYYKALHYPFLLPHPDHPLAEECAREALRHAYFLHFAGKETMPEIREVTPLPVAEPKEQAAESPWQLETPVVLTVFARPDTTARVMEAVRQARPPKLFVIADGPRPDREGEAEKCAATRAIAEQVDWDCELLTNYSDVNLGLKRRIAGGLDWVFEQVEEAIILEDDCVPHPSFFRFCQELLERYRNEPQVLTISGNNFQFGQQRGEGSYYFSRYPHIWGWATWRRAWKLYDLEMRQWPDAAPQDWSIQLPHATAVSYWNYLFQKTYEGLDSWAYALVFAAWMHQGLNIHPNQNLVSNLGVRGDATHGDNGVGQVYANLPAEAMKFPLRHPYEMAMDVQADDFTESVLYSGNLKRLFGSLRGRARLRR